MKEGVHLGLYTSEVGMLISIGGIILGPESFSRTCIFLLGISSFSTAILIVVQHRIDKAVSGEVQKP